MTEQKKKQIQSKALALRNAADDLLRELEEEQTHSTPRQRQNRREARVLDFGKQYERKKPVR